MAVPSSMASTPRSTSASAPAVFVRMMVLAAIRAPTATVMTE